MPLGSGTAIVTIVFLLTVGEGDRALRRDPESGTFGLRAFLRDPQLFCFPDTIRSVASGDRRRHPARITRW